MPHPRITHRRRSRGFSVVEIMVAMALSTILIAGVLTVVYSSKVTYYENEREGRLQENGRAALENMLRDLRSAGFPGCAQPIQDLFQIKNQLANANTLLWNLTQPVYGYEAGGGGTYSPTLDAAVPAAHSPGHDILVVRTMRQNSPMFRIATATPGSGDIVVEKDPNDTIRAPSSMVINDCGGATIFAASTFDPAADGKSATITRVANGTPFPTNADTDLKRDFRPGARVAPIVTIIYYIAPSETGSGPALWRLVGNSVAIPEEVIQGVEEMQLRYGVDNNGDLLIDDYETAAQVDAANRWPNVISVSIAMVIRSNEANAPVKDTKTYKLFDATPEGLPANTFTAPGDRYQRSVFTTTVSLRNLVK
jgi:type IV pilus assembly protein PilW